MPTSPSPSPSPSPSSSSSSIENENTNICEEYSQEYIYKFDDPSVQDCAYLQITNNKIIVQLPVKPDHTKSFAPLHHVQFYFNKQLIFHSNWLPILTTQDQIKFKTIFQILWHEYTMLTHI